MASSLKLLRYPGGKSRLLALLAAPLSHLIAGATDYAEPFLGGGSVALWVAEQNPSLRLWLNDADEALVDLWSVICGQEPGLDYLLAEIERVEPGLRDPDRRMDTYRAVRERAPASPAERAFQYFFLNKTNYGGKVFSTPIGGWKQDGWQGRKHQTVEKRGVACQYNAQGFIVRLRQAHALLKGRTQVTCMDALEFIEKRIPAAMPMYLDPPYWVQIANDYYQAKLDPEGHYQLSRLLVRRPRWLLSYDDSAKVRKLYAWACVREVKHFYASARNRASARSELLISSPSHTMRPNIKLALDELAEELQQNEAQSAVLAERITQLKTAVESLRNLYGASAATLDPAVKPILPDTRSAPRISPSLREVSKVHLPDPFTAEDLVKATGWAAIQARERVRAWTKQGYLTPEGPLSFRKTLRFPVPNSAQGPIPVPSAIPAPEEAGITH